MPGYGNWRVSCESDPRWNNHGHAFGDGLIGPQELRDWIEECIEKYGDPPDDCYKSFFKD